MQKISAYTLTFNEAEKIKAAVESVLWTDEVVVVDSTSTDGTAEIAAGLGGSRPHTKESPCRSSARL